MMNTNPAVLKVVEYILKKESKNEQFSLHNASLSKELNGIGKHQIAEIMRMVCLEPTDAGSKELNTTIGRENFDNNAVNWKLNPETYFAYLSYKSIMQAQIAIYIAITSLVVTLMIEFFKMAID